ncbi:MAG TPA: DUF1461 domain-containing protein [Coriobacteriia bacterium]|nr:DUF1461 domain-containing protein [Coriobacteriia bacterium]
MAIRLRRGLIALASILVAVGVALSVVLMPWFTEFVAPASGATELTGYSAERVRELALHVRDFVTSEDAPDLPATIDGRPAFGSAEVEHLIDVRCVLAGARGATVLATLVLAVLAAESVAAGRLRDLSRGMRTGGRIILGLSAAALLAGAVDFDAFFAGLHGIFFGSGTWTFPSDALMIRLFPLRFWVVAGASWGGFTVLSALVLIASGRAGTSVAQSVRAE